jgi:hypothetical protein
MHPLYAVILQAFYSLRTARVSYVCLSLSDALEMAEGMA